MPGLGPKSVAWLAEVGITSEAELRAIGAVEAWRRLRHWDARRVSRNMLWALHAALEGLPIRAVDAAAKARLLAAASESPTTDEGRRA